MNENQINLIGISGKKQQGKDSVAKIIKYLCSALDKRYNLPFNPESSYTNTTDWFVTRYALKLKMMVAILIGCKVEDLEKEEFKSSFLSDEWNTYTIDVFVNGKKMFSKMFPTYNEATSFFEYEKLIRETPTVKLHATIVTNRLTVRKLLAMMGTDFMREKIHPDVHINSLFVDYKVNEYGNYPRWIIADVRFPNEVEAIRKRGGVVIRVENPRVTPEDDEPLSETALDDFPFVEKIINDGTIEDLVEKVKIIIDKYNIK